MHSRGSDGRASRREHARRRAALAVECQVKIVLSDRLFDPSSDIGRIDDDDVSAYRLKPVHQLRSPDDVDGPEATRRRHGDHPPPDAGVGGVLHDPVARFQVDEARTRPARARLIKY
jgi:hypothetical protein